MKSKHASSSGNSLRILSMVYFASCMLTVYYEVYVVSRDSLDISGAGPSSTNLVRRDMLSVFKRKRYTNRVEEYTFDKLRSRIETAVLAKLEGYPALYGDDTEFELIEGFIFQTTQKNISGVHIGGSAVPMVGIISRKSARVRYFSLSALLPEDFTQIKALLESAANAK